MGRIVVLSRAGEASLPAASVKAIRVRHDLRFVRRQMRPCEADAARLLTDADILASTNVTLPHLSERLLDRLPSLRHVVLYATGHEHLDADRLDARGIALSTLPHYATNAVAEHALALIFACATRLHLANDRARGHAPADVSLRGVELTSRTLAVIGVGRIGTRLADLARGLGMAVLGVDRDPGARARAGARGIRMVSLTAALADADVVAVTASTAPGESPILGGDELDWLGRDTFVVNAGRPALVDRAAITKALADGRLRGYAVDEVCFDPADPVQGRLLAEGRVLQSAHSAWWRDEVLARGAQMFARTIAAAADGAPINVVPAAGALVGQAG